MADGDSGLQVIDISDLEDLNIHSSEDFLSTTKFVYAEGNFVYLSPSDRGFSIIDLFSGSPSLLSTAGNTESTQDFVVIEDTVYMANESAGLQILDIASQDAPKIRGHVKTPGTALGIFVRGDYAYVADGDFQIVNVSDIDAPTLVGDAVKTQGSSFDVIVLADYAYVADGDSGIQVIDVSDPEKPVLLGDVKTKGSAISFSASDDYIYLVSNGEYSGLQIFKRPSGR